MLSDRSGEKVLAVAVYNHHKRLRSGNTSDGVEWVTNIPLIGPTGSGVKHCWPKHWLVCWMYHLPMADATTLTEAGYVGEDVETSSRNCCRNDYDVEAFQRGIVYIDEIDKISRKSDKPIYHPRCVQGRCFSALLKLIEGTIAARYRHKVVVSIHNRNSRRLIPLRYCLSAAARLLVWIKWLSNAPRKVPVSVSMRK